MSSSDDPRTVRPLTFPPASNTTDNTASPTSSESEQCGPIGADGPIRPAVQCLFCDERRAFPAQKDDYLAHLYLVHHLIISDVQHIALLPDYLAFWRRRFAAAHFSAAEYCTTMLLDHLPDRTVAPNTEYFLLDDTLPLDRAQRVKLHQRRLQQVLTQHQLERTDAAYRRPCLFCRDECGPTRAACVEHLFRKHFLHLGRPENLVYIDELIDDVRDKLQRLVCLFCAKTFKDRPTLKEHMRKKGHKRINPDDKQYDKYYMVNYTKEPKAPSGGAAEIPAQPTDEPDESRVFQTPDDSDSDWSDWEEDASDADASNVRMRCLFCAHSALRYAVLVAHIRSEHGLDLDERLAALTFHRKVKVVNYVRKQMHERRCVTCEHQFADDGALLEHLRAERHFGTGEPAQWDRPNYLFPQFEEDALLFCLDDSVAGGAGSSDEAGSLRSCESPVNMADGVAIYAEDIRAEVNPDAEELSRELMIKL